MRTVPLWIFMFGITLVFPLFGNAAEYDQIIIHDPSGTTTVTFDVGKITRKEVLRYFELRPDNEYLYRNPTCRVTHTTDLKKFEKNCADVLRVLKDKRSDLAKFDSGLSDVTEFLKKRLDFTIYISEIYLKFFRTGSFDSFNNRYDGVVPELQCKEAIELTRRIKERKIMLEMATQKISKCIEDQFYSRSGRYPVAAWNRFLKSLPIRVTVKEPEEDRD